MSPRTDECRGCGAGLTIDELERFEGKCLHCRAQEAAELHPVPDPREPARRMFRAAVIVAAIAAALLLLASLAITCAWLIGGCPEARI